MRRFGIWFNRKHLQQVKKNDFIKSHKHLALTDEQLTEVWDEVNPDKKVSAAETPEAKK